MRSSSYPPLIDPAKHEKVGEGGFGAVYRISKKTVGKLVPAAPDPGGGLPADANPWREVHIHSRVNRLLDRDPSVRAVRMLSHAFDGRYMHILMESYDGPPRPPAGERPPRNRPRRPPAKRLRPGRRGLQRVVQGHRILPRRPRRGKRTLPERQEATGNPQGRAGDRRFRQRRSASRRSRLRFLSGGRPASLRDRAGILPGEVRGEGGPARRVGGSPRRGGTRLVAPGAGGASVQRCDIQEVRQGDIHGTGGEPRMGRPGDPARPRRAPSAAEKVAEVGHPRPATATEWYSPVRYPEPI